MGKRRTDLIVGGAPAGINIPPVEDGCLTIRTSINIMTIHGNKSTAPSGMEILEFPFSLIRRRKKANLVEVLYLFEVESSSGNGGGDGTEGIRFTRF